MTPLAGRVAVRSPGGVTVLSAGIWGRFRLSARRARRPRSAEPAARLPWPAGQRPAAVRSPGRGGRRLALPAPARPAQIGMRCGSPSCPRRSIESCKLADRLGRLLSGDEEAGANVPVHLGPQVEAGVGVVRINQLRCLARSTAWRSATVPPRSSSPSTTTSSPRHKTTRAAGPAAASDMASASSPQQALARQAGGPHARRRVTQTGGVRAGLLSFAREASVLGLLRRLSRRVEAS